MTWLVLFTGSYNTPRLLELSGIGNPEILSKFNITPVVNLPAVGENLKEHAFVISDFVVKEHVFTLGRLFDVNRRATDQMPIDRLRNDPTYKAEQVQE